MKKPAKSPTQTHRPPEYRPGTTLSGQAWRGQPKRVFYQYYYQLNQLGPGGRTQKDENGNRPNKVSAMFQVSTDLHVYRIHTAPGF